MILRGRRFFTLVEMLVVIAIIGILAALLMPSLQKALLTTRIATCLNNLRQLGLSATQYGNDSGYFPYTEVGSGASYRCWNALRSPLAIYAGFGDPNSTATSGRQHALFYCPANEFVGRYAGCSWLGYQSNSHLMRGATLLRIGKVMSPGRFVLLRDRSSNVSSGVHGFTMYSYDNIANMNSLLANHGDGCNYLFVDGHVQAYSFLPLYDHVMNKGPVPWGGSYNLNCFNNSQW